MDWTAALPTLLVTLREGFEAALVVGLILACLYKAKQTHLNPWVYGGIGLGLVGSVLVGLLLTWGIEALSVAYPQYETVIKPLLEAVFGTIAIVMLSWMLLWMTQQSRSLKTEIETSLSQALQQNSRAGWAVFTLVLIAVLREGFETVIFLLSYFQEGFAPWFGGAIGLSLAIVLGLLIFQGSIQINIRLFFQIMGLLLLLIIGGLLLSALIHYDIALYRWVHLHPQAQSLCINPSESSCILGPRVWDTSAILPDRQFPGILLKALFGYRQHLYLVQAVSYLMFITLMGGLYFRALNPMRGNEE
ncbi:FTR1 family iron permease [Roseofilum capinflatum]|uniref:FTR1 family protein n=1 Tax=Roseofilum capinflatum BLCC-M114 TaxID=3022440 RepID=A0ABT7B3G0_9CYAN|nr:FTR1 family protein [Roseofilum capinflatum]MDJ1173715.1 FTR1 family protein [Roseofilum capinflatum BLCC-M114]